MYLSMKYYILFILLFWGLCLGASRALAFESNALVNWQAPYATIYSSTYENLALDFTLMTTKTDVIKAIGLKNLGGANYSQHIKNLVLWVDEGLIGWQGLGTDRKIGDFLYSPSTDSWYIYNLDEKIIEDLRFFVSVDSFSLISKGAVIQLEIPVLADKNNNGTFDIGDLGIFLDSGDNGPLDKPLTNKNNQVFSVTQTDKLAPVLRINNLVDNQIINNDHYLITGIAFDQGNSGLTAALAININDQLETIVDYDQDDFSWSYNWQGIADGTYLINIQAYDQQGNFSQTAPLTVQVQKQGLGVNYSPVALEKNIILNTGLDPARGKITLKDDHDLAISNRLVEISGPRHNIISLANNMSDTNGEVSFTIRSEALGWQKFTVNVDDKFFSTFMIKVIAPVMQNTDLNFGDLIIGSNKAVYYFGADAKRYVFPTEKIYKSWYHDFSNLKKINDSLLAMIPLGGNVTYRPGSCLLKMQTDPKVYAIDRGGILRWIIDEDLASQIYGANWTKQIADLDEAFIPDYKWGSPLNNAQDFVAKDILEQVSDINTDKNL
jgi:hypothetical protein